MGCFLGLGVFSGVLGFRVRLLIFDINLSKLSTVLTYLGWF